MIMSHEMTSLFSFTYDCVSMQSLITIGLNGKTIWPYYTLGFGTQQTTFLDKSLAYWFLLEAQCVKRPVWSTSLAL